MAQTATLTRPAISLERDLARALDPLVLAADCGIQPDPWQAEVLTSASRKQLLLCSRQSGKSTTTALLALHEALYTEGALILLVSPSQRQSGELFKKVIAFWRDLKGAPEAEQVSLTSLWLKNGSRVISLPGSESTTRGYSGATLAVIDEAARVSDDIIAAIRPSLATTNGRLVLLSTPAGKRGTFYQAWYNGEGWHKTKVMAADCPRISAEFLAEERQELGEHMFRQEYLCEFIDDDTSVFSTDLIEGALSDECSPLWS